MRIGQLRHKVAIQAATETRSASGDVIKTWATASTVWAAIWPLSGKEFYAARQIHADATTKIRMRPYSGLTTKHRLLFGSRTFDILHIANMDERGAQLDLICTEHL